MKVIHIESGLGNQMLSYCEYLAMRQANPDDDVCIETAIFDIPECNEVICQWNGYELERVFGIQASNIQDLFSGDEWCEILREIAQTRFWDRNWNYPVHITGVLNRHGMNLRNIRGDFEAPGHSPMTSRTQVSRLKALKTRLRNTAPGDLHKRLQQRWTREQRLKQEDKRALTFMSTDENLFAGQFLSFKYRNNGIERIDAELRRAFRFPPLIDERNLKAQEVLLKSESVAIHVRRGDLLTMTAPLYNYGYFRRATSLIRRRVAHPVFVFFCDPDSVQWCRENGRIFGLNFSQDDVLLVDWNKGAESYRDMQLMALCKHNIVTNSSFGWWGAYLNENPGKITISPDETINTTHHC
jgi:hypothetical protein